jgi:NAD-dependent dihydropyrimidine dehydrogenase PreA subunit
MTYVITGACMDVKDQSCVAVCPVDCIYVEPDDRMCYIRPDECINCAVCVEACPVAAIYAEKDAPPDARSFIEVNALWFRDREAARTKASALKEAGA